MRGWILPASVFAITFVCLSPVIGAQFLNWDDDWTLTGNLEWRGLSPAHLSWMFTNLKAVYRPLGWMSHAADYLVWGMNPAGHHLSNLLIHSVNAVLVYFLILALVGARTGRLSWWAAAGALFFALHPLRVEPVSWVIERSELLAASFYLATVLCYLRMTREQEPRRRRWWYAAAVVGALLASLSKGWAMTLPVVLVALDVWPLRRVSRKTLIEKIPFVVMAGATALLAAAAARTSGAMTGLEHHSIFQRAGQAGYGLCFYVIKTLLPFSLSPLYRLDVDNPFEARFFLSVIGVVLATAALWAARRRWPGVLLAWVCYAVAVSPALGLVQSGPQMVADRFSYLSCIAWAVVAAAGLARLSGRWEVPGAVVSGIVLVALAGLSFSYTRVWRDSVALWDRVIEQGGDDYFAYFNRGHARYVAGDVEGACADYDRCGLLNPYFLSQAEERARALNAAGVARDARGDAAGAVAAFDQSLRLNPRVAEVYRNRGTARRSLDDLEGAISDFDKAIRADPREVGARVNRGDARRARGDLRGAMGDFNEAIRLDPKMPEAYACRALVWQAAGGVRQAAEDLRKALEVAPPAWPYRPAVEQDLQRMRAALGK